MNREPIIITDRTCFLHHDAEASHLLIQPVDEHDLELLEKEIEAIRSQTETPFSLVALLIKEWNQELTPWAAPPVFGKTPFGDGAKETLAFITNQLLPRLAEEDIYQREKMKLQLGGYSMAGLFALWSAYQLDVFNGIAAASPSVWYPRWIDYVEGKRPRCKSIFLCLGDKEERTKNPVMAQVGNAIRRQHELLSDQGICTTLEWNSGNHFVDSEKRMARGFSLLLTNQHIET